MMMRFDVIENLTLVGSFLARQADMWILFPIALIYRWAF